MKGLTFPTYLHLGGCQDQALPCLPQPDTQPRSLVDCLHSLATKGLLVQPYAAGNPAAIDVDADVGQHLVLAEGVVRLSVAVGPAPQLLKDPGCCAKRGVLQGAAAVVTAAVVTAVVMAAVVATVRWQW